MLEEQLKKIGLDEAEIKVYLASLELGETNISRIAKKSGVKRTTTYLVADSLKEKGLMRSIKKKNKNFFYAEDPRRLKEQMEESVKEINKAIPNLLAIANFIDKKPQIRFFEGQEGIKEVFKDTLKYPKQEIQAWFPRVFESFIDSYYVPKRLEKKIWVRAIMPDSEKAKKFVLLDQQQLRKSKLISKDKFNMQIEISLYGKNKIAIISFDEEIALIIESQKIHESLKSIFEIMWENIP